MDETSELIERVARAMWAERRAESARIGIYLEDWDEGAPEFGAVANNILGEARAAVEALGLMPMSDTPSPIRAQDERPMHEQILGFRLW